MTFIDRVAFCTPTLLPVKKTFNELKVQRIQVFIWVKIWFGGASYAKVDDASIC